MLTTLNQIRACSPCKSGWTKLLAHLGKTSADDAPLSIITVLDSNGLDDALWCLQAVKGRDREIRLYAVWCARQVQHLMTDPRSLAALDVAERFANGEATDTERAAAGATAGTTAGTVEEDVAWSAAGATAGATVGEAAGAAAWEAARASVWEAARASAGAVARDAAVDAQEKRLRELCAECVNEEVSTA